METISGDLQILQPLLLTFLLFKCSLFCYKQFFQMFIFPRCQFFSRHIDIRKLPCDIFVCQAGAAGQVAGGITQAGTTGQVAGGATQAGTAGSAAGAVETGKTVAATVGKQAFIKTMTGKIAIAAASIAIVGGVAGGTIAYKYSQDKAKATDKKEATEATDDPV